MFNHARTLLINTDGSQGYFPECPGEELIPQTYQKLELPTYLDVFRSRFFGADPDRAMLNYRSWQLLQLIESTELQSHVLALDPRITYDLNVNRLSLQNTFLPKIIRQGGTSTQILTIAGTPVNPSATGKATFDYQINILESNIQIRRLSFPLMDVQHLLDLTNGISPYFTLPLSGYKFCVNTTDPAVSWRVQGYLRPQTSLSEIEKSLRSVGDPYLQQLFGTASNEPYITFRNCWEKHSEFAYRLGGIVLAVIYRTEEERSKSS
jgi:hypothetical protein